MKTKITPFLLLFLILSLMILALTGCSQSAANPAGELDVTQAYQTVEAQLTQAVGQTPVSTETPTPTIEGIPSPTPEATFTATPVQPTNTPVPGKVCDQAAAAYPKIDITIEDDTEMMPGDSFTKIWRVVNAGGCTWTTNYSVVWFSGDQLSAPDSLPVNITVPPNQSLDISVDMVAPDQPGTYQSNWKLRNANGDLFGIGPNGESPFWVRIKVVSSDPSVPTATPNPGLVPTETPGIQTSGSAALGLDDVLDFDELFVNAGGADVLFQVTENDSSQYQLAPLGSASIGVYGGAQPSLGSCQSAGLSAASITVNDLAIGTYLCYNTDQGNYGWARIDAFDPDAGRITLAIQTWE